MTTPTPGTYTLEQAQQDVAGLRLLIVAIQRTVATVNDTGVLLYAPGSNAIPRGPKSWSFEDGTVQGWAGNSGGAVSNSTVTAAGWPTAGTHSLLLTANGSFQPKAFSPNTTTTFIPSQPGDPVGVLIDVYCPAPLSHVFAGILWYDDTGTQISEVDSADTVFTAGQVQTLTVSGTAPDLTAGFAVVFGDHNTDPNLTLIYGDNIRVSGNLAVSVSPGGGTDSVGNVYPAGIQTTVGFISNASGDFFYSGTPTFGNLIMSVAPAAGTDSFGNAYLQGSTTYQSGSPWYALNQNGFALTWLTAPGTAGPWSSVSQIIPSASISGLSTAGGNPNFSASGFFTGGTVTKLVSGAAETWHAMSLQNSWVNTGAPNVAAQYRLEPDNSVWLVGDISSGTITSGTAIATALPAAYRPAHTTFIPLLINAGASAAQQLSPSLSLDSSGNVTIHNLPTGTTRIAFSEKIKLDA